MGERDEGGGQGYILFCPYCSEKWTRDKACYPVSDRAPCRDKRQGSVTHSNRAQEATHELPENEPAQIISTKLDNKSDTGLRTIHGPQQATDQHPADAPDASKENISWKGLPSRENGAGLTSSKIQRRSPSSRRGREMAQEIG